MTRVAFVGLGAMGLPMASNLLSNGFAVTGYDLNAAALDALESAGGQRATDAASASSGADILILMVVNAAQAEAVLFEGGTLEALRPDGVVALMATCPPSAVGTINDRVLKAGRRLIDSPVSGGVRARRRQRSRSWPLRQRTRSIRAKPAFDALGDKVFHVGENPGQGAMVKTVNQLLCGVHIAVVAEAFALAAKVGVDLRILLEIMSGSSASSWMLKDRGPRMLEAEPEVTSAVDIFVKDLGIVLDAGRDVKAALPLAAAAQQMFLATSGRGDGSADDSQVIRSYFTLNGIK